MKGEVLNALTGVVMCRAGAVHVVAHEVRKDPVRLPLGFWG